MRARTAIVACVFAALGSAARAELSDMEIRAGYCLGVVTAGIPAADQMQKLYSQADVERSQKQIPEAEQAIASFEQTARSRTLTQQEQWEYDSQKLLLHSARLILETERMFLSLPLKLRTDQNRLRAYIATKLDPGRALEFLPLQSLIDRGAADQGECGNSAKTWYAEHESCFKACSSNDKPCVTSCLPDACQRVTRCEDLSWLPL